MNSKKNKRNFEHGFTSMDNRIFYLQEQLTPNAFSIIIRLYRMTEGYDGKPKALANAYFQKTCNMSKNTVTKALKELEDLELIYTKRRPRVSTLYLINLEKVDDIFQQVRALIISEFDKNESQDMGNIDNDESQNMTQCFPEYDLHESQNMGANKENTKENIIKENTLNDDVKNDVIEFDEFWNAYGKKVDTAKCKSKWLKLTHEQHTEVMANVFDYVAANNDKQYRKNPLTYLNGQCWLDEIVVRQPQQTNYQGNNHANHQSANSQPKQSSADIYAAKLAEQRRQREATNTTATGSDRANVYDMEETF